MVETVIITDVSMASMLWFCVGCYGGFIEHGPHRLMYLHAYSLVDRNVWEILGDMALLEEVCHRDWTLKLQKPVP